MCVSDMSSDSVSKVLPVSQMLPERSFPMVHKPPLWLQVVLYEIV